MTQAWARLGAAVLGAWALGGCATGSPNDGAAERAGCPSPEALRAVEAVELTLPNGYVMRRLVMLLGDTDAFDTRGWSPGVYRISPSQAQTALRAQARDAAPVWVYLRPDEPPCRTQPEGWVALVGARGAVRLGRLLTRGDCARPFAPAQGIAPAYQTEADARACAFTAGDAAPAPEADALAAALGAAPCALPACERRVAQHARRVGDARVVEAAITQLTPPSANPEHDCDYHGHAAHSAGLLVQAAPDAPWVALPASGVLLGALSAPGGAPLLVLRDGSGLAALRLSAAHEPVRAPARAQASDAGAAPGLTVGCRERP